MRKRSGVYRGADEALPRHPHLHPSTPAKAGAQSAALGRIVRRTWIPASAEIVGKKTGRGEAAFRSAVVASLISSTLAACDLAPAYTPPATVAPTAAYANLGPWSPAAPSDRTGRGRWWGVIADPELDALETRLDQSNPSLAAAVARYDEATALARRAKAYLYPEVDAVGDVERTHYPDTIEHGIALGGQLSYELDLWGRVRNQVKAAKYEQQASAADAASVRLSLEAELAEDYLGLRGLDAQLEVLRQTIAAYTRALELTSYRYNGGASSELDVGRAKTLLGDAQAEFEQTSANRAQMEHAIAVLVGESASTFQLPARPNMLAPPVVPVDAPSELLQRRPDIAAAERRVAEANANVGVFKAALYPTVTIAAAGGYETIASVANAAAGYWALGPLSAFQPVFDGGRRRADVQRAHAVFREQAADYRQTVLSAFEQVEDELVLANRLATAEARQQEAVTAAEQTSQLAVRRYTEGAADYLEVTTAQEAELQARQSDVLIRTQRLTASIDLVRALGGGWDHAAPQKAGGIAKRS